MAPDIDQERARLHAEAARVRQSGSIGKSFLLNRLFEYLLVQSLAGEVPKEIEVAREVFGKDAGFDISQDASVRVYVHRLRRKLEQHYEKSIDTVDRLIVPRGEYRLAIASIEPEAEIPAASVERMEVPPSRGSRWWWVVAAFMAINIAGWWLFARGGPRDARADTALSAFWRPIADSRRPTFVVTGDYYIFGEAPDTFQVRRLVRAFDINSRDDLDDYLMSHPADEGRYVNLDLHYLPVSTGAALRNLIPILNLVSARSGVRPQVVPMSDLTPSALKNANIVYLGFLSGLGLLRDPTFEASGFSIGRSYDELVDKGGKRRFSSDWGVSADGKTPQRDYGYLASLPGPTGNRILIVAGTRDAALAQIAEVAADRQQLDRIAAKAGSGDFEALYEVRALGNLNLGSSLVLARPLRTSGIWQPKQRGSQVYPDQAAGAKASTN